MSDCPHCEDRGILGTVLCAGHAIEARVLNERAVGRMSASEKQDASLFICPPRCNAGGTADDEGHVFNIPDEDETFSGYRCKCGLRNIDFDMWRMP